MFSALRVSLRRLLSTLLITTILFFSIGILINNQSAIAASSTRDVTNANMEDSVSDSEYESAKARRQRKQAQRSMAAQTKAKRAKQNEKSKSTQSLLDRITDD